MKLRYVGITGYKQSGKDTAAQFIKDKLGGEIMRFAQPIYDLAYEACVHIHKNTRTGRRFLQFLGDDLKKEFGKNYFIKQLEARTQQHAYRTGCTFFIIPDVRFIFEADWIKRNNGLLFKIVRNGLINTDTHSSENNIDKIPNTICIENNGSSMTTYKMWMLDNIIPLISSRL